MFYEERVLPIPLTSIEIAVPFTRRIINKNQNYSGELLPAGDHAYRIRETFIFGAVNTIKRFNSSNELSPPEIAALKVGPPPRRLIDRWFPIRLRSV